MLNPETSQLPVVHESDSARPLAIALAVLGPIALVFALAVCAAFAS
jgi:hypothetical protein